MSLRRHLAFTLLATAIPLVAGVLWLRAELRQRASEQALREFTLSRVEAIGRETCEGAPQNLQRMFRGSWLRNRRMPRPGGPPPPPPDRPPPGPGGPGRGRGSDRRSLEVFAYDIGFGTADPEAPVFPEPLVKALNRGADTATLHLGSGRGRVLQIGLRTEWPDGPCAIVLARALEPPRPPGDAGLLATAALLCLVLLAAVWVAAGPMVRRIRALTGEVRRSAASHYATPVEVRGSDEIAQLGGAFNEAAAEVRSHLLVLERRDRTLRSFLANTTHDVMLPLTVLQGHLATMKKRVAEGVLPNPDTVLAASEEAHYLASLVHNLSAAAKLETGEPLMQLNTVELNALVERVVERHRPIAEARGIELNYAVPEATLRVEGDLTLVEQAVSNLVHNAVRHNRPEGHVAVLLEETPGDSARFSLKVIDDGPGVPEEQLTHLGERRFRGDEARTRNPDGQGLGLHIARQVAERHGFELSFARAEQGGLEARLQGLCRVEQATRP